MTNVNVNSHIWVGNPALKPFEYGQSKTPKKILTFKDFAKIGIFSTFPIFGGIHALKYLSDLSKKHPDITKM